MILEEKTFRNKEIMSNVLKFLIYKLINVLNRYLSVSLYLIPVYFDRITIMFLHFTTEVQLVI